jgi:hypothetical protein
MQSSHRLNGSLRHSDKRLADIVEAQLFDQTRTPDCTIITLAIFCRHDIDTGAVTQSPPAAPGHEFSPSLAAKLHFSSKLNMNGDTYSSRGKDLYCYC